LEDLIGTMTNDPKDRHVLAAGIRATCEVLVTFNLKDFPDESVAAYDIEIVHPDEFLLDQLDLYPGPTVACCVSRSRTTPARRWRSRTSSFACRRRHTRVRQRGSPLSLTRIRE
jgi:hypothetical protein